MDKSGLNSSGRPVIPAGAKKPTVGILYSSEPNQNEHRSSESCNLAYYLCGLLSATGYAEMFMIPFERNLATSAGATTSIPSASDFMQNRKRIKYIPAGNNVPCEVPASDVTYAHMSSLEECDVIIITLNSYDTKPCCEKMAELLLHDGQKKNRRITVFSMQRGVRNSNVVKDILEGNKGLTVLECVVGFAVVVDPKHSAYVSTLPKPTILIERISKEAFKFADGPVRLLENTALEISFRKLLTPHAWGVLLYENLYVLNMLTKGSLAETLSKREHRLILALMMRETRNTLKAAARDSGWQPELLLVCPATNVCSVTPWVLEMILVLPDLLFFPTYWLLGMAPPARYRIISPGQQDLTEGKRSMLAWHFAEIVRASARHRYPAPVCALILQKLEAIERTMFPGDSDPVNTSSSSSSGVSCVAGDGGDQKRQDVPPYNRADLIMNDLLLGLQQLDYAENSEIPTIKESVKAGGGKNGVAEQLRRHVFVRHPTLGEWWFWMSRCLAVISLLLLLAFLFMHDY